ncbi:MAG: ATP-dependent helicase [Magnetococcales bacterium]|nr:ATP-dependent helicase [Magnetococcales bacterium]
MSQFRLTPDQQMVVNHGDGPLVVVAGPGSGKTRVLTERIRRLVTEVPGHFYVLALTFTNKAANEMTERLSDLGMAQKRVTISTMHGFCLELLRDRGERIGVIGEPQIFERAEDRQQILLEAAMQDPFLVDLLKQADEKQERPKLLRQWLDHIAKIKTHPLTHLGREEPLARHVVEAYDAGLRACGAYDFDDLLLLAYQLLIDFPKVADLYRRIYGYICIDEAQDLNEAQYAVLLALCGDSFRNVMMVGDPKQSIYGFNNASPEYMRKFYKELNARVIKLNENFRSSQAVIDVAKKLNPQYLVATLEDDRLPIQGAVKLFVGTDETHEAQIVCKQLEKLFTQGHTPHQCAILGRNQYLLMAVENELQVRGIPFYKRFSSLEEYDSPVVREFQLALRIFANPRDQLHLNALARAWEIDPSELVQLGQVVEQTGNPRHFAIKTALNHLSRLVDLRPCIQMLQAYADKLEDNEERRAIYNDTQVLLQQWDHYLRSGSGSSSKTIAGFMSSMALGTTRQTQTDGVGLLSVHASKGLEFDVVFMIGMVDGVFPDYRAKNNPNAALEEQRSAFVAVTRSKRLLYLTYPKTRKMPWGEVWHSRPSPYLQSMDLVSSSSNQPWESRS